MQNIHRMAYNGSQALPRQQGLAAILLVKRPLKDLAIAPAVPPLVAQHTRHSAFKAGKKHCQSSHMAAVDQHPMEVRATQRRSRCQHHHCSKTCRPPQPLCQRLRSQQLVQHRSQPRRHPPLHLARRPLQALAMLPHPLPSQHQMPTLSNRKTALRPRSQSPSPSHRPVLSPFHRLSAVQRAPPERALAGQEALQWAVLPAQLLASNVTVQQTGALLGRLKKGVLVGWRVAQPARRCAAAQRVCAPSVLLLVGHAECKSCVCIPR